MSELAKKGCGFVISLVLAALGAIIALGLLISFGS